MVLPATASHTDTALTEAITVPVTWLRACVCMQVLVFAHDSLSHICKGFPGPATRWVTVHQLAPGVDSVLVLLLTSCWARRSAFLYSDGVEQMVPKVLFKSKNG